MPHRRSRSPASTGSVKDRAGVIELDSLEITTMLQAFSPPCLFDQDPPHRLGRGSKEMAAAVPVLGLVNVHQAQVRLVNHGRRLEGLAGWLVGQLLGGKAPKLGIDQRQQLSGHLGVALLDRHEDPRNFEDLGRQSSRAIHSCHGHDRPRNLPLSRLEPIETAAKADHHALA